MCFPSRQEASSTTGALHTASVALFFVAPLIMGCCSWGAAVSCDSACNIEGRARKGQQAGSTNSSPQVGQARTQVPGQETARIWYPNAQPALNQHGSGSKVRILGFRLWEGRSVPGKRHCWPKAAWYDTRRSLSMCPSTSLLLTSIPLPLWLLRAEQQGQ